MTGTPEATTPPRGDRHRRWLAAAALVAVVAFAGTPAAADDTTTTTAAAPTTTTTAAGAPASETSTSGLSITAGDDGLAGMIPPSGLRPDGDVPTLYERYPPGAYTWDSDLGYSPADVAQGAADGTMSRWGLKALTTWGTTVTRILGWVFTAPQLGADVLDRFQASMRDGAWPIWLACAVSGIGLYLMWLVARMRISAALSHAGWVLALGTIGFAFLLIPGTVTTAINRGATNASKLALAVTAGAKPDWSPPDGTVQAPTYTGDVGTAAIRGAQDTWWRLFVVIPWEQGEFGSIDQLPAGTVDKVLAMKSGDYANLTDNERAVLAGKATVICEDPSWLKAAFGEGPAVRSGWAGVACGRQKEWKQYRDDVLEQIPGVAPWINGHEDRTAIGWAGFLVALPSGILFIWFSLAILWWSYEFAARILFLPVAALAGMAPEPKRPVAFIGPSGFTAYAQKTVATLVSRFVASLVLAVCLILQGVAANVGAVHGWIGMVVSQLVATGIAVWLIAQHRVSEGKHWRPTPIRSVKRSARHARERADRTARALGFKPSGTTPPRRDRHVTDTTGTVYGPPRPTAPMRATIVRDRSVSLAPPRAPDRLPAGRRPAGEIGPGERRHVVAEWGPIPMTGPPIEIRATGDIRGGDSTPDVIPARRDRHVIE